MLNMSEIQILAAVRQGYSYGREIAHVIRRAETNTYLKLKDLRGRGLITPHATWSEIGPPRVNYTITDQGKEELESSVAELIGRYEEQIQWEDEE